MSLSISANNPFRPADWRWKRAVAIYEGDPSALPASRRRDGTDGFKWITTAIRFQREYAAAANDVAVVANDETINADNSRALLAERRPEIFWAHWCWSSNHPMKSAIEAQLLARSSDYTIGYRCNMHPAVIACYEALFFNVREKLQHRSYILNCVMGPAIHRGLSEREYDLLWKLYGYFLGPCIVDALEGKFVNPIWCDTPTALGAAVMDDAISTLKLKAAIATKTVAVNATTQMAVMEAFTKFVEIERTTDSAGKAQEQILDHISAMMTTLPFSVGGRRSKVHTHTITQLDDFEKSAIELTYEETMRLSVGHTISHQNILQSLRFPTNESTQLLESK